jgi:signal transduction histidine kinase
MDRANQAMQLETVMTIQAEGLILSAEAEGWQDVAPLLAVPIGSTISLSGVCLSEINGEGKLKVLTLLLPPGSPLQVVNSPPWITTTRLSVILAVASGLMLLFVAWNVVMSNKNRTLKTLVHEKEQAQKDLQLAHTRLEDRVRQRTEQLKQQISARKESELQFKATLTERTRLAQELHDTLEQTLTGVALQMDTATRLVDTCPDEANQHLSLARKLVGQGQTEVRRSVWDLRSRALEQFSLPAVLKASARQLTDGTAIEVTVNAIGAARRLPDIIEDNLLRIAQEGLTNAIKHSGCRHVSIQLSYDPDAVRLEINDDGIGFDSTACAGPSSGHFGLLGISERAKRINAQFSIRSSHGEGTSLCAGISLAPETNPALPIFAGMDV